MTAKPLAEEGGQRAEIADDGGQGHLTWTLPVRAGASFASNPLTSAPMDEIVYRMLGDDDLAGSDLSVVERTHALGTGLPPLDDYDGILGTDYAYRSFRLVDPTAVPPAGLVGADVFAEPQCYRRPNVGRPTRALREERSVEDDKGPLILLRARSSFTGIHTIIEASPRLFLA